MADASPIRVLVVDDSASVRAMLRSMLETDPHLAVVGEAADGIEAVAMAETLRPNVITMDLHMPRMGGIDAITSIMSTKAVPILVVSSQCDAQLAYEAVSLGALDVMGKPDISESAALITKVKLLAGVPVMTHRRRPQLPVPPAPLPSKPENGAHNLVFAIASSTGGPQALAKILGMLPAQFPSPVLIAQHISEGFAAGFADWLDLRCPISIGMAKDGDLMQPGQVYISPSERNLIVTPNGYLRTEEQQSRLIYHPSCDRLLSSVADSYGKGAVGIILTGMGRDGADGMGCIARVGGTTLGQDEESSIVFGMNREAIVQGHVHTVLPLAEIAPKMYALAAAAAARATV